MAINVLDSYKMLFRRDFCNPGTCNAFSYIHEMMKTLSSTRPNPPKPRLLPHSLHKYIYLLISNYAFKNLLSRQPKPLTQDGRIGLVVAAVAISILNKSKASRNIAVQFL